MSLLAIVGLLFLLAALFIVLYILWMIFKIILTLLKAYATVIILIMFAPIIILFGALTPNGGFSYWAKSLASNLAVFPVVGFMFMLAIWFASTTFNLAAVQLGLPQSVFTNTGGTDIWSPPLTFAGNEFIGFLWLGVSLVIFTNISKASDIIKSVISGQPFNYGSGIGESLAGPSRLGFGLAKERFIGGAGVDSATRVRAGGANLIDRLLAGYAKRQGYIEVPSPSSVRRRSDVK